MPVNNKNYLFKRVSTLKDTFTSNLDCINTNSKYLFKPFTIINFIQK